MPKESLTGEEKAAVKSSRHAEVLSDCYNDDTLWGYSIRAATELEDIASDRLNDPVLDRLIRMGIFDWKEPNELTHEASRVVRYTMVVTFRLLQRILSLEQQVWLYEFRNVAVLIVVI